MRASKVYTPDERVVARQLLIELLVHQFAFPVQWIATQDRLLLARDAVRRYIEIGPSSTLTGMARKTVRNGPGAFSSARDQHYSFLSSNKDQSEICYQYDPPVENSDASAPSDQISTETKNTAKKEITAPVITPLQDLPSSVALASPVAAVVIQDVPLFGEDIVRALVARKVRKPIGDISTSKTIQELCGGKSTLQNEIVGDLYNEFEDLPDRPEEVPLCEFRMQVSNGPEPKLGMTTSALLSKLVASKMPARFNVESMRTYLASKWGFGPSRQLAVLCFVLASEPPARLPSSQAAEEYLDNISQEYADVAGIKLQVQIHAAVDGGNSSIPIDPAVLTEFSKAHSEMAKSQFEALAKYLKIDLSQLDTQPETQERISALQAQIDAMTDEFSEDFFAGIAPVFDPLQMRRYNSSWNLARQDLLGLYHGRLSMHNATGLTNYENLLSSLTSRATVELFDMARALAQQAIQMSHFSSDHIALLNRAVDAIASGLDHPSRAKLHLIPKGPRTTKSQNGSIAYDEIPRSESTQATAYIEILKRSDVSGNKVIAPLISLSQLGPVTDDTTPDLTTTYLNHLSDALTSGFSLAGSVILLTGAGEDSIGAGVLQYLLQAGAHVIVTSSRAPAVAATFFRPLYERHASRGAELTLVRCNQASVQDCERLIDYIYATDGLNLDLDAILPFAAMSEIGAEISDLGAKNELAHRMMLSNVLRLLGRVIYQKRACGIACHPTQVLLPLSPNHGDFGGDGLYSESKLGLESLLNRARSESWSEELSICGVRIGWTRSTGLMRSNDVVADAVEKHGVLTFSVEEMAVNIVTLLLPEMIAINDEGPMLADFSGGLSSFKNCSAVLADARRKLTLEADIAKAIAAEDQRESLALQKDAPGSGVMKGSKPRTTLKIGFPSLPSFQQDLRQLDHLRSNIDPSSTVVVVGFSELGPWGSARARWEMECHGRLSRAGSVETAWTMGLIRHFNGEIKGSRYIGWVDAKTGEPIDDVDIPATYASHIAAHTGIRPVEPAITGHDPSKKEYLEEIIVEDDLPEFEASRQAAEAFKLRHGDHVSISSTPDSDVWRVCIRRGATLMVPKAVPFAWGSVAGQFPTGWSPERYGIPKDVAQNLDPAALYAVCCVSEAFFSAGISNPLEIYQHIHLAEIGNFLGSSMGGAVKTRNLYKDVFLDRDIRSDVLQDTYLNTAAAWINMLLLGSAGPIKTPVGACATGVESIDSAMESIMAGKTKMCLVGGYDDFQEDESYGFSRMKATVDAAAELARGRLPAEMSRPSAESRSGFVEAYGCGVQILCRADVAIEMGLPIYGVIAGSTMAADKIGRSVPAPGQGILTFARESRETFSTLAVGIDSSASSDFGASVTTASADGITFTPMEEELSVLSDMSESIDNIKQKLGSLRTGTNSISPIRAALSRWGLTIDDLDVVSLHGTSTKANDINEPDVICKQMEHLGRTRGYPLWAVSQKSVTGHPKAPAAAWMLNGCLQMLDTGIIPGNRNADNIDSALQRFEHLCFATQNVQMKEIKAFLLNSFGFGQKGGQVVGIAPKYFLASLGETSYEDYCQRVSRRKALATRSYARAIMSNSIVRVQDKPQYEPDDAAGIYLDPSARATFDSSTGNYRYTKNHFNQVAWRDAARPKPIKRETTASLQPPAFSQTSVNPPTLKPSLARLQAQIQAECARASSNNNGGKAATIGIDLVELHAFTAHANHVFLERNFTDQERLLLKRSHTDPRAYFASRWCAKEAVFKCLGTASKGAGAAMTEIEIVRADTGVPRVVLYGDARRAAEERGIREVRLSLSHEDDHVIAIALGLTG